MPELPEVETVRRGLNQVTLEQPIRSVKVLLPRAIATPDDPAKFMTALCGCVLTQWQRRGKYLVADLSRPGAPKQIAAPSGGQLGVHLRMSGQLLWMHQAEPVHPHTRVCLGFDQGQELRFVDQRTFGRLWWVPPGEPVQNWMTGLARLGPEPLSSDFSLDYFQACLSRRQRAIKTALLDQAIVAGIGNIYADEALFLAQIHPECSCHQLSPADIERLHQAIQTVLTNSIEAGGTTFSSFRSVAGVNGHYSGQAWVYGRKDEPCRQCGTPITRIRLGGRSSHFCPQCQSR